jgi:hypothetical protein
VVVWAVLVTGAVLSLMALVVLDQLGFAVLGRSLLPWRRRSRTRAALAVGTDQITALFYATKHHELEQRATEAVLREDAGDAAPRRLRLDLDTDRPTLVVDPLTER